jgi:hypothetical protein
MGPVRTAIFPAGQGFDYAVRAAARNAILHAVKARHPNRRAPHSNSLGVAMNDLLYIGLTILIFLLLAFLVKGVEHFER